jgi:hypothetical protein
VHTWLQGAAPLLNGEPLWLQAEFTLLKVRLYRLRLTFYESKRSYNGFKGTV